MIAERVQGRFWMYWGEVNIPHPNPNPNPNANPHPNPHPNPNPNPNPNPSRRGGEMIALNLEVNPKP